jgi:hypothetical protein
MGFFRGPNIITDGLVLALDAANIKSFKGEPTTNLVTDPLNITSGFGSGAGVTRATGTLLNFTGQNNAGTITGNGTASYVAYVGNIGATTGNKYTTTWYLKAGTKTSVDLNWGGAHNGNRTNFTINLLTGAVTNLTLASGETYSVESSNNGFYKISYSSTLTGANYYPQISITTSVDYLIFGGIQIEQKPYATPFVNGTRGTTVATGGGWADRSGNSNHGELVNGVGYNSGNLGSLVFDGVDDHITTSQLSGRNPATEPFTIEAWVKSDQTVTSRMWIDATSNGTNQRFYATLINGSTSNIGIQGSGWSDSTPNDTNWHYQAIVMDGNTARGYDNGIQVQTKSYTSYTLPGPLIIGGRSGYIWLGQIANFKIYNRALTADEVLQNYNALKSRYGL